MNERCKWDTLIDGLKITVWMNWTCRTFTAAMGDGRSSWKSCRVEGDLDAGAYSKMNLASISATY
jgi:hypothetical protein